MRVSQERALNLTNTAVSWSGLGYFALKYFSVRETGISALEINAHDMHVIASPLLIFAVAWIWDSHFLRKFKSASVSGRRSGLALAVCFWILVLSGYALQAFVGDETRKISGWLHSIIGCVWAAAALFHFTIKKKLRRRA